MLMVTAGITLKIFAHFRWHNEIHDISKLLGMIQSLDAEEADLFDLDLRKLDMALHA